MDDLHDERDAADATGALSLLRVLLYSDRQETRQAVIAAVGRRIGHDMPTLDWLEVATHDAVVSRVAYGGLDLLVLDGESSRSGGLGLCRQLKDEVFRCPPVLVLIGRDEDRWLASWSEADAVVAQPFDPLELQEIVAQMLRVSA